jgi:hypothetical protein
MSPNEEIDSINTIKKFLGIDFKDGYKIIEHISRNNHPDRPLHISILFSEESFNEVFNFIDKIESSSKETIIQDKEIKYVEHIRKQTNCFVKDYEAKHIHSSTSEYTFFISSLTIDYDQRILTYRETSI